MQPCLPGEISEGRGDGGERVQVGREEAGPPQMAVGSFPITQGTSVAVTGSQMPTASGLLGAH